MEGGAYQTVTQNVSKKHLLALPVAALCYNCQKKQEENDDEDDLKERFGEDTM